ICKALIVENAVLRVFDPAAMDAARQVLGETSVNYCSEPQEAVKNCDAVVLVTEWNEFRNLDLAEVKEIMKGDLLFDTRNVFDIGKAKESGLRYVGTGRG